MQPIITFSDKHKFRIAAFECKKSGKVSQKTIDLTPHAGQRTRVWLNSDGTYSTDRNTDHYWQVAEFDVPHIKYEHTDTGEMDDNDTPVVSTKSIPPDMTGVKIKKWTLPA